MLAANFIKQTFTIVASAGNGGTISPSGDVAVEYGENRLFSISADSGYEISDVWVNGQSVGAVSSYQFEDVTADQSIHASFEMLPPDLYSLTLLASPIEGGGVYGAGDYEAGSRVSVSAMAYPGYQFIHWTLDGQVISTQSSFTFTIPAENVSLVAHFEEGTLVLCSFSQGYWFAKPQAVWPYDVVVGGLSFSQAEGQQFWPPNSPTKRAFTQYATIYLSGVTLSEFSELQEAVMVIDNYFAKVYPAPANGQVNKAAGFIGDWVDKNHCVETLQGIAQADTPDNSNRAVELDGTIQAKAFPSPFRSQFTLEFQLEEPRQVTLELFDITGERINVPFEGPVEAYEKHTVVINGKELPAGFYFYRLTAGKETITGRLIRVY
ncbi:MAG: T9SS type A sorting domain-containing protein [Bacteroidales bacterium]|nr:T9SS type A sorting domain-containing protein [Bacteroidales bacterium]NLM93389.1 T9SS type A sorting domain-containing protein [Bacteroidales bacterium]